MVVEVRSQRSKLGNQREFAFCSLTNRSTGMCCTQHLKTSRTADIAEKPASPTQETNGALVWIQQSRSRTLRRPSSTMTGPTARMRANTSHSRIHLESRKALRKDH